ncbi:MAG TPA: PHB depolymerase family esterase [Acetobacteraceae bacterium]|jgi:feruloyl esterase
MHWSKDLRALRRGARLATRVTLAQLRRSLKSAEPVVPPMPHGFLPLPAIQPNPGGLRGVAYLPGSGVLPDAPLIVLLHGCGQDAIAFATDAGWTALADRLRLPLLLAEQQEANHRQRCFQWFQPDQIARGQGEAGSIAAMVRATVRRFACDPHRVFIAGLSAGGAMAAAMLAAYPELFAAGAVVAGLPVGTADGTLQALTRMAHGAPAREPDAWAALARRVAPAGHAGPWPRLSVWHGAADDTVVPVNGEQLAAQFVALHRLPAAPTRADTHHACWGDAVELWRLPGVGHAWPVAAGGAAARFTTPGAVAAVPMIARFWGLAPV